MFRYQGIIFRTLQIQKCVSTNTSALCYNVEYRILKIMKYILCTVCYIM